MIDLREYGWSEELEDHRRAHQAPNLVPGRVVAEHRDAGWTDDVIADMEVPGRVVAEHRDLYRVQAAAGELSARIAGRLRYQADSRGDLPAVRDWVLLDAGEAGGDRRVYVPAFLRKHGQRGDDP